MSDNISYQISKTTISQEKMRFSVIDPAPILAPGARDRKSRD